jgi:hydroxyethylthiazole kinase-like uncharacterized protein yjeF
MHAILSHQSHPLHNTEATRAHEKRWLAALPPHTLIQRAGLSVARLAQALAPHAVRVWVACGGGNNGADGLEAAAHLRERGLDVTVSWLGHPERASGDTLTSLRRALDAGVRFCEQAPELQAYDLCIDALLGLGAKSAAGQPKAQVEPRLTDWIRQLNHSAAPVLSVDLPSGLGADSGDSLLQGDIVQASYCLSLLTLKPGLFTGQGRDAGGLVWLDTLGLPAPAEPPCALLSGAPPENRRRHSSHKGSYGDVAVVGGEGPRHRQMTMTGAALLAARAALHAGAGRVMVALLDDMGVTHVDPCQPELMFRSPDVLDLTQLTVVAGCGGGEAIRVQLPKMLATCKRLVLDADGLNAVAADRFLREALSARASRNQCTILTPHPLEAARLLGTHSAAVQADRLGAADALAQKFRCVIVLKGSGTIITAPDQTPYINPTGNPKLATAGTGDALAGLIGARLAAGLPAFEAAWTGAYLHGQCADQWPKEKSLTASGLASALHP